MSLTAAEIEHYVREGFVVRRQAFAPARIHGLRDAVHRLCTRAAAGEHQARAAGPAGADDERRAAIGPAPADEVEIGWIDREQLLPARLGHLLAPDKYDPAYSAWLADDLVPAIDSLIASGAGARHSLFGMLAGGGSTPYKQSWHRGKRHNPPSVSVQP